MYGKVQVYEGSLLRIRHLYRFYSEQKSGWLGFPRVNPWMQYFTNMFHYGRPLRHKPMHSSYIRCIVVHANLASTLWLIGNNQAIHDIATVSFK